MNKQKTLPEHLLELLKGGQAHVDFEGAVKDWPANLQGKTPKGAAHSGWELLEHMRIAQWDILEFTRNPKHVSPEFPGGVLAEDASASGQECVEEKRGCVSGGPEGNDRDRGE